MVFVTDIITADDISGQHEFCKDLFTQNKPVERFYGLFIFILIFRFIFVAIIYVFENHVDRSYNYST